MTPLCTIKSLPLYFIAWLLITFLYGFSWKTAFPAKHFLPLVQGV